jgi:hypothetical protein
MAMTFSLLDASSTARHSIAGAAASVVLCWTIAAVIVASTHARIDATAPIASVVFEVAVIVLAGFAYSRVGVRAATLHNAMLAGAAWLVFAIGADIIATLSRHTSLVLLGTPTHLVTRNVLLVAWAGAPALFAREH